MWSGCRLTAWTSREGLASATVRRFSQFARMTVPCLRTGFCASRPGSRTPAISSRIWTPRLACSTARISPPSDAQFGAGRRPVMSQLGLCFWDPNRKFDRHELTSRTFGKSRLPAVRPSTKRIRSRKNHQRIVFDAHAWAVTDLAADDYLGCASLALRTHFELYRAAARKFRLSLLAALAAT
jgi:hypothetical protein